MRTVFVTGGSGFVGGALLDELAERGEPTRALARSAEAEAAVVARGAVPVRGDLADVDALTAGMRSAELVGEVAYAHWTDDGRMRHPVWRGLRPDKRPDEVVREG